MTKRLVAGVLLAGGQSRRMGGGDKCLRPLAGKPILAHIIARARPQVSSLVLNANGDSDRRCSALYAKVGTAWVSVIGRSVVSRTVMHGIPM